MTTETTPIATDSGAMSPDDLLQAIRAACTRHGVAAAAASATRGLWWHRYSPEHEEVEEQWSASVHVGTLATTRMIACVNAARTAAHALAEIEQQLIYHVEIECTPGDNQVGCKDPA